MSILRPGSKVPNRKPMQNLHTCSGYPQWNTYASLDYIAATTELRINSGEKGGSVARPARKLDPSNLCHRMRKSDTFQTDMENKFNRARVLSLRMDRLEGPALDLCIGEWGRCVRELIDHKQTGHLRELRRLERARGQVRIVNALKFAKFSI